MTNLPVAVIRCAMGLGILIALCGMSQDIATGAESAQSLKAGAFAQDITPPEFPISVNGNMADALATAAHDPLHARCLVLANQETTLAIVVCDSCVLPRELAAAAPFWSSHTCATWPMPTNPICR